MAALALAVDGLVFSAAPSGGDITITSAPSTKVFAEGSGVYRGPLNVSLAGFTLSGSCEGASGAGAIPPTSVKTLVDGQAPIRETDNATITVYGSTPGGSPCSFGVSVTVQNAGQTKVLGE